MSAATQLLPGIRVTVYGKAGSVVHHEGTDVHVRLDGEGRRIDIWQRSQVEVAAPLTAETITDEQIRELRGDSPPPLELMRLCAEALAPERAGCTRRHHARARCAEILNARTGVRS